METKDWNVVTGANGYTGKYITRRLLALGEKVKTLTGHPNRPTSFGNAVPVLPFNFENEKTLKKSLEGVKTIYNTYWVRFSYGHTTYDLAIENTKTLIRAAKNAGVQKFVHVSIANPDENSPLPYYRGKGILERELIQSELSYTIIRPTVIFGDEDILINNIAWFLRNFPIFAVPGSGMYGIQPIFVEDMADITVEAGHRDENVILDAVGPHSFTFNEIVQLIAKKIGSRTKVVHFPPWFAWQLSRILGIFVGDVVLTNEEVKGLMDNLLVSNQPPLGKTRLVDWLGKHRDSVGIRFASELKRHFR